MQMLNWCVALLLTAAVGLAQPAHEADPIALPTSQLLSEAGPTFRIADQDLPSPLTFILYGDQRFTDPANTKSTNPRVRRFLVDRIAEEKPGAVILNGDVPLSGAAKRDYAVFRSETEPWRTAKLNVFPALGNHEFRGDPQQALENWWNEFPQLRNRRWYSAQLGSHIYIIALDSNAWLTPGSDQARWLDRQLKELPASIEAVVLTLHHPPVADIQTQVEVSHNPRSNEIALRDYLAQAAKTSRARFLVSAGHIHNYERHTRDGVVYLVSGGGGAQPSFVERTPDDEYQSVLFPNFHYVKVTRQDDGLHVTMYRVSDPEASLLTFAAKDDFDVRFVTSLTLH